MSLATLQVHGSVAVITLDNPPVNSLSHAHRARLRVRPKPTPA